jgi:SAM-dependent methyltransferase
MSSRGDGAHAERPAYVATPGQEPAAADTSPAAPAADDTEMAGVAASTAAQMRVPTFGVRYLEQARRQLFARHPEYLPFLVRHLGVHPGMTVVDVGCGTGIYTRVLASRLHGEGKAIGIDLQPALIAHAHQVTQAEGWGELVEYIPGDATALPLPDACADVVFCNSLLWLLPDAGSALREMRRVLRPGGRALAAEPDSGLVHSYDPTRPRLSELEQRFQECFVRGSRQLDQHDYDVGRKLPSLFLAADFVAVRAYPRLFVAAGCDLGDDPQAGLAERVLEYRGALAALESTAPELRAQREHRIARARAGGMSDSELAEHERETLAYLRERVEQPARILTDGAVYLYGGILCEGMRFEAESSASEQAT